VRVDNPTTGEPIAGVPVDFKVEAGDDDDDQPRCARRCSPTARDMPSWNLTSQSSSASDGKAIATQLSAISAKRIDRHQIPDAVQLTLTTDKPLYQPGQTVHMRALAFGPDHRALANVAVKVTLADDQGQTQFEDTLNTSKFGVAKTDWEIPQKLQLGDISITAEVQSDRYSSQESQSKIRISRYELPTYTVKVTPDRPTIFRSERQRGSPRRLPFWQATPARQGEGSSPGKPALGFREPGVGGRRVAGSGRGTGFRRQVRRTRGPYGDFHDFKESSYQRFEDLTLAAYVTDLSTKRTEQRRFKLRLSAQPIHLYLSTAGTITADAPLCCM